MYSPDKIRRKTRRYRNLTHKDSMDRGWGSGYHGESKDKKTSNRKSRKNARDELRDYLDSELENDLETPSGDE